MALAWPPSQPRADVVTRGKEVAIIYNVAAGRIQKFSDFLYGIAQALLEEGRGSGMDASTRLCEAY